MFSAARRVEVVLADQPIDRGGARHCAQLPNQLADDVPELHGPSGLIAVPERHLSWLAGRGGHEDAVVRDLLDAPGRRAECKRLADIGFEHHLLIELTDAYGSIGAGEENAIEAAIRNRPGVRDCHALGAFAPRHVCRAPDPTSPAAAAPRTRPRGIVPTACRARPRTSGGSSRRTAPRA